MQTYKRWRIPTVIFIICLFVIGEIYIASGQEDVDPQDLDTITINNPDYEKDRKGPVVFPHRKHALDYKVLCWECHHNYDDKANVWSPWDETEKCIACHDPSEADGDIVKLQTAYHLNCKICHTERKILQTEDPLAYRKCTTCHEETGD
ncbi:MAG: cytochrome c3 family protein [Deltaproteobacteria bacterium]|nr:cytochrome c3 family protein [Deltaproteobacteria bacterium]